MSEPFEPSLSSEQKEAFDAILAGGNVFLSGPAGVGKSFVIRQVMDEMTARGRRYRATATTGIAACALNGVTIHKLLGTMIAGSIEEVKDRVGDRSFEEARHRFSEIDSVFIDEVSMLSGDYVQMMDFWLRKLKDPNLPFGGIQIVCSGDFLQLPPIDKDRNITYRYAFNAPVWGKAQFEVFDLRKSFRQNDQIFVNALNEIRFGKYTPETRAILRPCVGKELANPTHLVATNLEAGVINRQNLKSLPGQEFSIQPIFSFNESYRDRAEQYEDWAKKERQALAKDSLVDQPLIFKVGAPVLMLKNDEGNAYFNGSRGEIVEYGPTGCVKIKIGEEVCNIYKKSWVRKNADGRPVLTMTQFPFRLAYALTIHRAQGLTLDNVEIDMVRAFAPGQVYVALSRMKSLEGLALADPIKPSTVFADQEIIDFYEKHAKKS